MVVTKRRNLIILTSCWLLAAALSLTPHSTSSSLSRRKVLASIPSILTAAPAVALASITKPLPQGISTVVLDSKNSKLGVQLRDAKIGPSTSYPVVQSLSANGLAAVEGVQVGMVVLNQPSAAAVATRLQRGPYPYALQFYNLGAEEVVIVGASDTSTPAQALERAQTIANRPTPPEPKLSAKGTGLVVTTVRKLKTCDLQAKRGDSVTIAYEARVASPGGPVYDSSAERGGPVSFVLGDGKAISGVDVGLGGMCQGEVRELDIPSKLGYGRSGSNVFDVPGDVRLWWRVELLELAAEKQFPFR
jgi:FK506-binding protein 2